jgi:nuclear RNA export factor
VKLKALLGRRYDASTKVLNLTNISAEPEIQVLGGAGTTLYDHPKLIRVLCTLCEDAFPTKEARAEAITGIQLGGNGLGSLNIIKPVVWTFPELVNLDLSNNAILRPNQLFGVRNFKKLQHIILTGNPIETTDNTFRAQLIQWFPELKIIDAIPITEAEAGAAKTSRKEIKLPVQPGLWNDDSGIGENFLKEFFVRFDGDRQNMPGMFYDETSQFSISVNTNSLREPGSGATGHKGEWNDWIRQSRNLLRIDHLNARKNRLHTGKFINSCMHFLTETGVTDIANCFAAFPPTQHPEITDLSKWIFESLPIGGLPDPNGPNPVNGLLITVHGELVEFPNDPSKRKSRSFDRTFTLGPNKTGGVRIVNDSLLLRNYGGTQAFPQNQQLGEDQQKTAMIAELQRRTGLNTQYAKMCLEENGWKFEVALEMFQSVKANIPPEAFGS